MKKFNLIKLLLLVLVALPLSGLRAQQVPVLPIDEAVRYGKLENGLTYYVRSNALPEDRVHF
ncbi:MAG: hypothetical protein II199_02815, partial [Bacteroidaceae bacterium]|nr:hypothetical protein [Bacteroidaceae bacterium]